MFVFVVVVGLLLAAAAAEASVVHWTGDITIVDGEYRLPVAFDIFCVGSQEGQLIQIGLCNVSSCVEYSRYALSGFPANNCPGRDFETCDIMFDQMWTCAPDGTISYKFTHLTEFTTWCSDSGHPAIVPSPTVLPFDTWIVYPHKTCVFFTATTIPVPETTTSENKKYEPVDKDTPTDAAFPYMNKALPKFGASFAGAHCFLDTQDGVVYTCELGLWFNYYPNQEYYHIGEMVYDYILASFRTTAWVRSGDGELDYISNLTQTWWCEGSTLIGVLSNATGNVPIYGFVPLKAEFNDAPYCVNYTYSPTFAYNAGSGSVVVNSSFYQFFVVIIVVVLLNIL